MRGIGIVGFGYWGPHLARNFSECPGWALRSICDLEPERLKVAAQKFPGCRVTSSFEELLADPSIDAIAICTPVASHFSLADRSLEAGKHILIEKPATDSLQEVEQLRRKAAERKLIALVDHTFVYSGAVRKIKELVDEGSLGNLFYYDSVRVNLGLFREDSNVIWDLAVHDVAIMDYLFNRRPRKVSCMTAKHITGKQDNLAYLTLGYEDQFIGHIHVSWLAPIKLRTTLICGSKQMVVYDDIEPSEKIKIYDKGVIVPEKTESFYSALVQYRIGDGFIPRVDASEALRTEVLHFLECIEKKTTPITGMPEGSRVVEVLEAAVESSRRGGSPIEL